MNPRFGPVVVTFVCSWCGTEGEFIQAVERTDFDRYTDTQGLITRAYHTAQSAGWAPERDGMACPICVKEFADFRRERRVSQGASGDVGIQAEGAK